MEQFHRSRELNNSYLLITGADWKDEFDEILSLKNMEMLLYKIHLFSKSDNHTELLKFYFPFTGKLTSFTRIFKLCFSISVSLANCKYKLPDLKHLTYLILKGFKKMDGCLKLWSFFSYHTKGFAGKD